MKQDNVLGKQVLFSQFPSCWPYFVFQAKEQDFVFQCFESVRRHFAKESFSSATLVYTNYTEVVQ